MRIGERLSVDTVPTGENGRACGERARHENGPSDG
jgi:hypothetical protein